MDVAHDIFLSALHLPMDAEDHLIGWDMHGGINRGTPWALHQNGQFGGCKNGEVANLAWRLSEDPDG